MNNNNKNNTSSNNTNNNTPTDIIQRQETLKRRWHDSFYTRLLTNNPNNYNYNYNNKYSPTSSSSSSFHITQQQQQQQQQQGRSSSSWSLLEGVDRERELVRNIVPAVTVVLEGRSICQRINLHSHPNYQSLAMALRHMFADTLNVYQCESDNGSENNNVKHQQEGGGGGEEEGEGVVAHISKAIPGHLVAYEDLDNDLLLAGDLRWKDFVRVAKRIRILPAKSKLRKGRSTKH